MLASDIKAKFAADGLTMETKLLKDNFNGTDGNHTFQITLKKGRQEWSTEYSAGCAHRHYPNGKPLEFKTRLTLDEKEQRKTSRPNTPQIEDVMYCLTSDAGCVAYGQSFEDFCAELGYDSDSIKAQKIYYGCIDTYLALKRFGYSIEELQELFQDY